jgi:ATP-dependent Clp protease ATP-binding subunit ClpC
MRRAVQKEITDPLSEELLRGSFKGHHKILVALEGNTPTFIAAEETSILSGVN